MEEVLGYAAAQRAKEAAVQAAKEAEMQRQREDQARQLIRKHVIRYVLRRRLRAKVKIRRSNGVADMQSLLFGSMDELLGSHPAGSTGDAEATLADPSAMPDSRAAVAPMSSGCGNVGSKRLKSVTTMRGLRAQAKTGELSAPAKLPAQALAGQRLSRGQGRSRQHQRDKTCLRTSLPCLRCLSVRAAQNAR